jgi:hypothetical protein
LDTLERRFDSVEDADAYMAGDRSKAIPMHIQEGNSLVPNPKYREARFAIVCRAAPWVDRVDEVEPAGRWWDGFTG